MKSLRITQLWPGFSALLVLAVLFGLFHGVASAQAPTCAANVPGPLPFLLMQGDADLAMGACTMTEPSVDGTVMTPADAGYWNYQLTVGEGSHKLTEGSTSLDFNVQALAPSESWTGTGVKVTAGQYPVNIVTWMTTTHTIYSLTGWAYQTMLPANVEYWDFNAKAWTKTATWGFQSVLRVPLPPTATPTSTTVPPTATVTPSPTFTPTATIVVPPTETATPTATATSEPPACLKIYPMAPMVVYQRDLTLNVCSTEKPVVSVAGVSYDVEAVVNPNFNWRVTQPVQPTDKVFTVTADGQSVPFKIGNVQASGGIIDLGVVKIKANDGAVSATLFVKTNIVLVHGWTYDTSTDWTTYAIEGWKDGKWTDAGFWGEYTILHIKQIRFLNFLPNVQNFMP